MGTSGQERKAAPSLLPQTEIHPTPITKAVSILREDHHFCDVWELFKCSINFRGYTRICTDPWRVEATAEFDGRGPCLRHRAFLVQRQCEVWASNRQGCRAVRWTTEHRIEFREVASLAFGEGRPSD